MPDIRVGISGWRYKGWRGNFYPAGLAQKRELEYASRRFNTLEINGTHYSLQRPESFRAWYDATPPGFVFAVKAGRYITHYRKLREIEEPMANFFAQGLLLLKEKLGPILWQFPQFIPYRPERFEEFLELLPRTTKEASRLASRHSPWMKSRAWTKTDHDRPIRHAVEVRNGDFLVPEFMDLLRRHDVSFVIADTASKWPTSEDVTASFVYLRLHGSRVLYQSGYTARELDRWAKKVRAWAAGREPAKSRTVGKSPRAASRDVYVYFDNTDVKLRAPIDAASFAGRVIPQGQRAPGRSAQSRRSSAGASGAGTRKPRSRRAVSRRA
ncbi:MAG: DUF72 domain-containing protein [Acidobacteriota bacterium]